MFKALKPAEGAKPQIALAESLRVRAYCTSPNHWVAVVVSDLLVNMDIAYPGMVLPREIAEYLFPGMVTEYRRYKPQIFIEEVE